MDHLQFLKHIWTEKFDRTTASQLVKSYRSSSSKQMHSVWKKFKQWLPHTVKILKKIHILRYLIWLHNSETLASRTVLSYRGALALPLKVAFNINTCEKEFKLLAKAQFLTKPAPKKRVPNWSLKHALEYFSGPKFNQRHCTTRNLFFKALFLTAGAAGNRASELAACAREGIIIRTDKITPTVNERFLY